MDVQRARVIGSWLRENRGEPKRGGMSQDELLDDIRRVTGWAPHRPNYSKYENGRAEPEPETLDKLVAYWASRGLPGPDFTPPAPTAAFDDLMLAAVTRQADATKDLVDEIRLLRSALAGQADATADGLGAIVGVLLRLVPSAVADGSPPPAQASTRPDS